MSDQTMYFRQVVLKKLSTKVTHHGITFIGDSTISGDWYTAVNQAAEDTGFEGVKRELPFEYFHMRREIPPGIVFVTQISDSLVLGIVCNSLAYARKINSRMQELGGFKQYKTDVPESAILRAFGSAIDAYNECFADGAKTFRRQDMIVRGF